MGFWEDQIVPWEDADTSARYLRYLDISFIQTLALCSPQGRGADGAWTCSPSLGFRRWRRHEVETLGRAGHISLLCLWRPLSKALSLTIPQRQTGGGARCGVGERAKPLHEASCRTRDRSRPSGQRSPSWHLGKLPFARVLSFETMTA